MSTKELIEYINNKVAEMNKLLPNYISDEQKQNYIKSSIKEDMSSDEINTVIRVWDNYLKKANEVANVEYNPEELDTNSKTSNRGVFLSGLQIDAISLINCNDIDEINKWMDSVPNLYMIGSYEKKDYNIEELESIKKDLFEKYQESMLCTETVKKLNSNSDFNLYLLHKIVGGLNLSVEEEKSLGNVGISSGVPTLYKQIREICVSNYGLEKGAIIFNKIINYNAIDYENFNSSTYEQMKAFSDKIKENVSKCNELGGNYQLTIHSVGYKNTVKQILDSDDNIVTIYNYDTSKRGQDLAERLGASYRLRSMIDRNTAEELVNAGFDASRKDEIIEMLRDSLNVSLQSFNDNIKNTKIEKTYELFNELIEIKKENKEYKNVWEDKFNIALEDIIDKVITPNMPLINILKSKNVGFMYNETLLQESKEKRDKVEETIDKLQRLAPGLITKFGDQCHTYIGDYSIDKVNQLTETAKFDEKISKKVVGKDTNGNNIYMEIECSEKDITGMDFINYINRGVPEEIILKDKQNLFNIHSNIYKSVPFKRESDWLTLDNISGDYLNQNIPIDRKSYFGRYSSISNLARKNMNERIDRDVANYIEWKKSSERKLDSTNKSLALTQSNGFVDVIILSMIAIVIGMIVVILYSLYK